MNGGLGSPVYVFISKRSFVELKRAHTFFSLYVSERKDPMTVSTNRCGNLAILVAFALVLGFLTAPSAAGIVVPVGVNASSYYGSGDTWHPWGPVINQAKGFDPATGISCCSDDDGSFEAFTGVAHNGTGTLSNGLMGFDLSGPQAAGLGGNASEASSLPAAAPANSAGMANYPLLSNYAKGADTDDKPRNSWFTDAGQTEDQWVEIELPALTPLEQIWIWTWNDGPENRMAGSLDISYSATDVAGLVTASEGTAADAAQMNWVSVADDAAVGSSVGRQKGRLPDWEQAFNGAQARYIRISDVDHVLANPSGGHNYVGLSSVLIFEVPEPSTAILMLLGFVGMVSVARRVR